MREKHGMWGTSEYRTWHNMKERCYNKNDISYKNYGNRGITVCEKWRNSFIAFFADMGLKPFPRAQIDRIDNDGNYEPDNCRWVTAKTNRRNSSQTKLTEKIVNKIKKEHQLNNVSQSFLAKKYNVDQSAISYIIRGKIWT